jgi:hemoglobin/transferrin/lactoferrin receptor protein
MFRIIPLLIVISHLFAPALLSQTARIPGRVTDPDGRPLAGAHVSVADREVGTVTDTDGEFLLTGLPMKTLVLRVSHVGFAARRVEVQLSGEKHSSLNVTLQPHPVTLDEVTVSATRSRDLVRNIPQPVTVVGAEMLRSRAPVGVADALDAEPGIALVRDGIWGTDVSIRGMQRSNVVTLVDGVRIETATNLAAGLSLIDVTDIERVEVLRGASSSMHGTGATGGVVNVITRGGTFSPGLRIGGEMSSSYSSVNNGAGGALALEAADTGWYLRVRGGLRAAEDAQTPDGVMRDSRFHDNSLSVSGGLQLGGTHSLRLRWQRVRADDVGIPGGASFPATASARYSNAERTMLLGEYRTGALGDVLQDITLRYARQVIDRNVEIKPNAAVSLRPAAEHDMHSVQLVGAFAAGVHRGVIGIDAWQRSYDGLRVREITPSSTVIADLPLPQARFRAIGLFAQDDISLLADRLRLSLGGRLDGVHVENDEGYDLQYRIVNGIRDDAPSNRQLRWPAEESDELSWSAHAGVLYRLTPDLALTGNVSRAFRAPALEERYQFIELGGATYVGDPDLAAEKGSMFDLGARYYGEVFSVRLNAFLRSMQDLVVDARVSDTLYRKDNVGEARIYGLEFSGEYNPLTALTLFTSLAYVRGEDTGAGQDLPQMPPLRGRAGMRIAIAHAAEAELSATFAADQDAVAPGESRTPGYALYHLRVRSRSVRIAGLDARIIAGVENIFDRSWRRHLSTLRGMLITEPGRNMTLRLQLGW